MSRTHHVFAFAHVGDLHLERNGRAVVRDLDAILDEVAGFDRRGGLDFIYLPGDMAEHGRADEYARLEGALARHPALPIRLIPGDHDRQGGTMTAFAALFARVAGSPRGGGHRVRVEPLPRPTRAQPVTQFHYAETLGGVRCLFLDMVSAGYGQAGFGLDFRLGCPQRAWIEAEIAQAAARGQPCAVFAHAYPADLRLAEERTHLAGLIRAGGVRLVEMGHTHYNELAPDGRTLYAAARSVGQNEDGCVGYAVAAIDGEVASWRFKPLDRAPPFVLITHPADRRLATAPLGPDRTIDVRALVLADADRGTYRCLARIDGGSAHPMVPDGPRTVHARIDWPDHARTLTVEIARADAPPCAVPLDADAIEPVARRFEPPPAPSGLGSDAARLGAWPVKGLRGDQLGPNRNGRQW